MVDGAKQYGSKRSFLSLELSGKVVEGKRRDKVKVTSPPIGAMGG